MEIVWDSLDPAEWAARAGTGLQQSWRYGAVAAAMGARVRRALVLDGGREVAVAQVLSRGGLRLCSRGPVWLAPVDRRAVLRRLGPMLATPAEGVAGWGLVPLVTPRHHAIWDLRPMPEALRAGMAPKWRARLRASERGGLAPASDPAALGPLLAAEAVQRQARGYRALPAGFARAWPADEALVLAYAPQGRVEAAALFLIHGTGASYHLAWASEAARAARAHWAILWDAAQRLRARGIATLDLGDVDTEGAMGLARFKLGTGAALARLGSTCLVLPG